MITTGLMLISILTMSFFPQLPDTQLSNQTTLLAVIDIVDIPDKKDSKAKKGTEINADTLQKKKLVRKPKSSNKKIKMSGYKGDTFVYGEIKPLKNDDVQGFIYHSDSSKTYVYGKKTNNTLNLYDTDGNLYQMRDKKSPDSP